MLSQNETDAVFALCLLASFADGRRSSEERTRLAEIGANLRIDQTAGLTQKVVLNQVSLEEAAGTLQSEESRRLAYEMAVYVCDADGSLTPAESDFLARLERLLSLTSGEAAVVKEQGEAIAASPVAAAPQGTIEPADSDVDSMILKYAILNGALELLPQSLATMAILPLQMKMVYRIGTSFGVTLDQGHIREFLATLGLGLTAQAVEGFARKLLGRLGRSVGGRVVGWGMDTAGGAAITFAATYALGHAAKTYYAAGRRLDLTQLRQTFQGLVAQGQTLFPRYQQEVTARSRSLSVKDVMPLFARNR